jgi:outer membrane protein assembly factor BamB
MDRRRRTLLVALGAVVAIAVTALVGYRVFRPGELIDPANLAYPAAAPVAQPKVYGTLLASPLVVDGRLRVYAGKRQVYADLPVNIKSSMSHYWTYRRWPGQLVGVAAVGTTVVSLWSDGALVGLDGRTGTVAWRAEVAQPSEAFDGRRTGAATVYTPHNLLTAGDTVIALGVPGARAFDVVTGRELWQRPRGRCEAAFTTPDTFVAVDSCATTSGQPVDAVDARTGAPIGGWPQRDLQPLGCAVGDSGCRGVTGGGQGWTIGPGGTLQTAPGLAAPGTWLVDGAAVHQTGDGTVEARRAADDTPLWTTDGTVIAVEPGAVHLVTAGHREVVTLDSMTGRELSRFPLVVEASGPFDLGGVYAADRYLFIQRARPGATPDQPDSAYFYPSPNVVLTGS